MNPGVDSSDLDQGQRARVEALNEVKKLLSEYKHPAEPMDLHALAQFILTGRDPWAAPPMPDEIPADAHD